MQGCYLFLPYYSSMEICNGSNVQLETFSQTMHMTTILDFLIVLVNHHSLMGIMLKSVVTNVVGV